MRELVGSAFVQDAIGRVASYIFSKREEKASTWHNIERLEMAHTELEFALERTGKLPITDVSLLRRRKLLKRSFEECSGILHGCKIQAQEDREIEKGRTVVHSSFPKRIARATQSSIVYLFATKQDGLYRSDVRRFEWLADCAAKFVRDVEYGCSIRHYTFCSPLLRQLLEGKTLRYEKVHRNRLRDIYIRPICLEERGIEAKLSYRYEDYRMPENSFHLRFLLRLSENTDLVGIVIKCLMYLASQFKLVAETAIGELTLLPDLHELSHSFAPPWFGFQETCNVQLTQVCRPDPICCKSNGHETCAKNVVSSGLSKKFPEQVISIYIQCSLHGFVDEAGRNDLVDLSPPLQLWAGLVPHGSFEGLVKSNEIKVFKGRRDHRYGNVEQDIEMVRSKKIDYLIRQPELADYITLWEYNHGFAFFSLKTRAIRMASVCDRSKTKRVANTR